MAGAEQGRALEVQPRQRIAGEHAAKQRDGGATHGDEIVFHIQIAKVVSPNRYLRCAVVGFQVQNGL